VSAKAVNYQAVYLWECPDCGTTWQTRHRPRAAAQLVCTALAEQNATLDAAARTGVSRRLELGYAPGCGSISVSAGRRKGIAPNVSI